MNENENEATVAVEESADTGHVTAKTLHERIADSVAGAERLRQISGIGTELGTLENIRSAYSSEGVISDDDIDLVDLVTARISEFDQRNLI